MVGLAVDKKYPIENIKKNYNDASILFPLYSGKQSTLKAFLEYNYQSYIVENDSIKNCFISIANCKLYHHKLLGETIYKLGLNPMLADGRYFFSGSFINYELKLKAMLENDIINERLYIDNYKKSTLYIQNDSINKLICRFIEDNKLHLQTLENLYKQNF